MLIKNSAFSFRHFQARPERNLIETNKLKIINLTQTKIMTIQCKFVARNIIKKTLESQTFLNIEFPPQNGRDAHYLFLLSQGQTWQSCDLGMPSH